MPTDAGRHSMHVALCCDDQYAPMAGVTALSILLNRRSELDLCLHICHSQLSDENKEALRATVKPFRASIEFHPIANPRIYGLRELLHITHATYFRLLLADLLEQQHRVIYLDCDLVVECDLEALWDVELRGCAIAGWDEGEPSHLTRLNLEDDVYINAGVLLIDLDSWRKQGLGAACLQWIEANGAMAALLEQDAINVVLKGKKSTIPEHWNLNPVWRNEEDLLERYPERVIHFGGPIKPWDECYDFKLAEIFKRYVFFSPWRHSFPFRKVKNPTQQIVLAHQFADAGKFEIAARTYHAALGAIVQQRGALPLVIRSINHGVRAFDQRDFAQAVEHFKDCVESFNLPRNYSKNIYRLSGLLDGMF
jgi:lipopolysaccharide biosynthesis glycosyltransferase